MKNSKSPFPACWNYKRQLFTALFSLAAICTYAQVMEWAIKPEYKDIVYMGGDLYKVKNGNGKWGVYNINERELTIRAAYDSITPLVEDRALILDAQGQGLLGIIDKNGNPVRQLMDTPSMIVMQDYPYYSNGLLVVGVLGKQWYEFGYVDKNGEAMTMHDNFTFLYACPFDNGLAMIRTAKGSYHIIDKQGSHQYQGNTKIKFLSNPKNGVFVLATGNSVSKGRFENRKFKEEVSLERNRVVRVNDATATHTITCAGSSTYSFDNAFHLIEGNAPSKVTPVVPRTEYSARLKKEQYSWQFGLSYNRKQLLEPQFKNVKIYEDQYALVTMPEGGTKGLLRLNAVGKVDVSTTPQTITFYHNQQQTIPLKVECTNMMQSPAIEIITSGTSGTAKYMCQGAGTIEIPFFEPYSQSQTSTEKTIGVDIVVDKLKYGHKDIKVMSSHQEGFSVSFGGYPAYSNKDGSAQVNVVVTSNNGTPSPSARVEVNGTRYYFNGGNKVSASASFHIPIKEIKSCPIIVKVTEDGCRTIHRQTSGKIKNYYLR